MSPMLSDQPNELALTLSTPERQLGDIKPVGYFCDHSDEPFGARTHHDWEWDEENGGHTFQHQPNTISSHSSVDRGYLKPEDAERRCPRAVPVYAVDAPALVVEINRLRADLEPYEMLTGQQCENGKHADWAVDSEHNHLCPWCRIAELKTETLNAAIEAARSEYLHDGTGTDADEAYNQGVTDAIAAIGKLLEGGVR